MQETPESTADASVSDSSSKWGVQRIVLVSAGGLGGIIILIFVIGLLLILASPLEATALRLLYLRNIAIIALVLEGLLIIGSLAVLIVQITRLINLLKREVRPVIGNVQGMVSSAKGTVEFVGDTVAQPIVQTGGLLAGIRVIVREVGGIRRAVEHRDAAPASKLDE